MAPRKLQLIYFAVRARAEASRMILEFGGNIPYTDESSQSFWGKGWKDAKALSPMGQLPALVVDGSEPIAQSGSIVRYCASLVPGLTPIDALDAARCDAVFELSQEMMAINPIVNIFRGEQFEAKKAEYFSEVFPPRVASLVKALGDGPFFFGAKPLYCDFNVYSVLDNVRTVDPAALQPHPTLLSFMQAFEALPGVSQYLAARPKAIGVGVKPMLEPNFVGSRAEGYPRP